MNRERGIPYPAGPERKVILHGWQHPQRFGDFLKSFGYENHSILISDKRLLESFYRWRHLVKTGIFTPAEVAEKLEKRVSKIFKGNEDEINHFYQRNLEIINLITCKTTPLTNIKR